MRLTVITMATALALAFAPACGDDSTPGGVVTGDATVDTVKGGDGGGGADGAGPLDAVTPDSAPADVGGGGPDVPGPDPALCGVQTLAEDMVVDVVNGFTLSFTLDVPAGAVSVLLNIDGPSAATYGIARWDYPDGSLVPAGWQSVGGNAGNLCISCPMRISPMEGAFAALAPNNPNATFEPGTHTISLLAYTLDQSGGIFGGAQPVPWSGPVTVSAFAKMATDLPATGVLNINLHLTGARGWTAANAPTDPEIQRILTRVGEIYAQVGVSFGTITYLDLDPTYAVLEELFGDGADLELASEAASNNGPPGAVNVMFVDEIMAPEIIPGMPSGIVFGIAGGIPGPALVQGTLRSAVAITVSEMDPAMLQRYRQQDPTFSPPSIETTMAHEVGHYLGLFHTIEADPFGGFGGPPPTTDPLPDTPDTDDKTWLMHNIGSGDKMSEWQGLVMRSNPWVCTTTEGN